MAEQDVQVKEIDVIKLYNKKFGDFLVSISQHASQLQHVLQEKQDMMEQSVREMKKEQEKVEDEIRLARRRRDNSYNHGTYNKNSDGKEFIPDREYIRECQEELDHLEGKVRHQLQTCAGLGHHKKLQGTQIINFIMQRTQKLLFDYQNYVRQGRIYLDKVEQYIDQYKENDHKV